MTTTPYNIHELKILIRSNILKNNDTEYEKFELTKDNLYLQDQKKFNKTLNTYPYFTYQFEYPRDKLLSLSTRKRIEFFFNLDQFVLFLATYGHEQVNYEINKLQVSNHNVMVMLEILFPTQFPIHNDIKDSHNHYINGNRGISKQMLSMITHPFESKYSYIKHNGKVYTTRRVIWINDMLNHSIYNKLINLYVTRKKQGKDSKSNLKITNEIDNIIRSIDNKSNSSTTYTSINNNFQEKINNISKNELLNKLNEIFISNIKQGHDDNTDNKNKENKIDKLKEIIETSVLLQQTTSKTYYYIELSIDYFQGEINSENKNKFICNFTNNHLGDLFEKMVQTKEIDKYKQKWNVDLYKAALYQSDVPVVTKRSNDMKLEDSKKDVKDDAQGRIQLFSDIIENGSNTKNYIQHLNKNQGLSIETKQIYEDGYLETIRENKYSDVIKKLYELLNQEEDTNSLFLKDNVNKIKNLQKIKLDKENQEKYKTDPINTLEKTVSGDDDDRMLRIFMYFLMEDIIKYMSTRGFIRENNNQGGRKLKTKKHKKKRSKNATIKKN